MRGPIYLVGMMASGKSTIGRMLAKRLGRPFLDLDSAIERRAGKSVEKIFADRGERKFRQLEALVLAAAAKRPELVVAAGGGAVLRAGNRRRLQRGLTIFLKASPGKVVKRVPKAQLAARPLLGGRDPLTALKRLMRVRLPLYREVATFTQNAEMPRARVLAAVLKRLKSMGVS